MFSGLLFLFCSPFSLLRDKPIESMCEDYRRCSVDVDMSMAERSLGPERSHSPPLSHFMLFAGASDTSKVPVGVGGNARKSTHGGGEREIQNGKKKRKVWRDFGREKCVEKDFQAKVRELESVDERRMREGFRMGLRARKLVLGSSEGASGRQFWNPM
jgi:hypothetical protein